MLILLLEVGLESDLGDLLRSGPQSALVAAVGVIARFAAGYGVMYALGYPPIVAVFVGATLTATSVGITARVLADLGRLQDPSARVVLGAAVVDDILGLIILGVVTAIAETGGVSLAAVGWLFAKSVIFLAVAFAAGVRLAPLLVRLIGNMKTRGTLTVYSVVVAVALAAAADLIGLATIIGAFTAGLVLAKTERRQHIEHEIKPVANLLVPIFFVTVGMKVGWCPIECGKSKTQLPVACGEFGVLRLEVIVVCSALLDHFVSACEQRGRNVQAQCVRGLAVDDKIGLHRLSHWYLRGARALEDERCLDAELAVGVDEIGAVAH